MFTNVIRAIVELKNHDEGVTINSISEQLRCYVKDTKEQKKDSKFVAQIRRALQRGVRAGIIVREGKKYKLGIRENTVTEQQEMCNDEIKSINKIPEPMDVLSEIKLDGKERLQRNNNGRHRIDAKRKKHSVTKLHLKKQLLKGSAI